MIDNSVKSKAGVLRGILGDDKLVTFPDFSMLLDAFELVRLLELDGAVEVDGRTIYDSDNRNLAHFYCKRIRKFALKFLQQNGDEKAEDLYRRSLLFDAPVDFDSAIRYAEWNRPMDKRFYEPRRKQLLPVVEAMQQLEDNKLDLLCISEPPGIGKTTIAIMFMVWSGLRHPELTILGGSHNNEFLRGVYDEINRMLDPQGEYLWREIFPAIKIAGTNAKALRLDLDKPKRFQTFEFSSIGSGNAGKVRATNLLYCDDLVDGIETAMNKERLDKLWEQYTTDYRQRKQGNAVKELHIATRWSIHDVIGRLETDFGDSPTAKFIKFAALNENDESNFDYPYGLGFSTKQYHEQREIMDDASWRALYMNEPIEREGQLYAPTELRRYFELPDTEPDAIISVCDTKEQGDDYCVMPIAYKYGQDYYIAKIICDNGKPDIIEDRLVHTLINHRVKIARFESNRGGTIFAKNVQEKVKAKGGHTKVTTKWNQANKDTRIIVASGWVKEHCLFLDESLYPTDKEYRTAMQMLTGYTMAGKNKHDDVPDAFADLEDLVEGFDSTVATIKSRRTLGF